MHVTTLAYHFLLHDVLGNAAAALIVSALAWGARLAARRRAQRRASDGTTSTRD
ncbi:hypothetical protein LUR56_39515 [Streptomyces sp. MT29]|nr:hypothetical protein [Streptomyces sp. MT29]